MNDRIRELELSIMQLEAQKAAFKDKGLWSNVQQAMLDSVKRMLDDEKAAALLQAQRSAIVLPTAAKGWRCY
jgi:hypothetical protein